MRQIDVDTENFVGCYDLGQSLTAHLVKHHDAPRIHPQKPRDDMQFITSQDFMEIVYVHFADEDRAPRGQPVRLPETEVLKRGVCRMIKNQNEVGDVHMAIVVNPLSVYLLPMAKSSIAPFI